MKVATAHPTRQDLARFALSDDPGAAAHDNVRRHVHAGCRDCEKVLFALCVMPPEQCRATARTVPGWIRPRRIESRHSLRTGALADYQLVCGAGPYELDVLVREVEETPILKYQGQVTLAGRIHEPAADLSLYLIEATTPDTLVGTNTNTFGEFGLASRRDGCYGLRLGSASEAPCVLVWEGWEA